MFEQPADQAPTPAGDAQPATFGAAGAAAALAAAASLAACGGGDGAAGGATSGASGAADGGSGAASATVPPKANWAAAARERSFSTALGPPNRAEAARFLLQCSLSASQTEIDAVVRDGYVGWLIGQLAVPTGQKGWDWLQERGYGELFDEARYFDRYYPGDYMIWWQLFNAKDSLRKRLALALSEYFVVSLTRLDVVWPSHLIASWWDLLVEHAYGNFRDLLEAVALHPAMGVFLSSRGSQKENAETGRRPDENFARELLQLFTIGLHELNADGTPRLNAEGVPIDTYSMHDVTNLARVFTGYDFDKSQSTETVLAGEIRSIASVPFTRLPMRLDPALHSPESKEFLGTTIPAGTDGNTARRLALDAIFRHPNVGPFLARQMIQRLVTSNPSPAYVARVAALFNDNGGGVRGDLRFVWAGVLLDDEARGATNLADPMFGKLREPMLRLVQWGRTFGLQSAYGSWKMFDTSDPATALGQSPLRAPSVFNFYRPGYVPPSTQIATSGHVAPEFQIITETSVAGYLNFMQTVVRLGIWIPGPEFAAQVDSARNGFDLVPGYEAEMALVADARALIEHLNTVLCAGQLAANTVNLFVSALEATPIQPSTGWDVRLNRVASAVFLVMSCPEYLVQK